MKKSLAFVIFSLFLLSFVSAIPTEQLSVNSTTFSKQIVISPEISNIFNILFKLPEGNNLSLQSIVFLLVLSICLFFIIQSVVGLIPFFEGTVKSAIISFVITLLSSMGGGINYTYIYLVSLSQQFDFISNSNSLALFISLTLIISVSIIFIFVIHGIRKIFSKEKSKQEGFNIGKTISENKMYSTIFKESIKDSEYDK